MISAELQKQVEDLLAFLKRAGLSRGDIMIVLLEVKRLIAERLV